jgi:hypothetical protein
MGTASGVVNTLQRFGAALGVAVVSAVFVAHGSLASPADVDAGFRPALAVAAGFSLLGALCALGVTARRRELEGPPEVAATTEAREPVAGAVG